MTTTLNSLKPNTPRPLWPWLVGATALAGGYAYFRKRNVDIQHKHGNIIRPETTQVDIKEKGE